MKGNASHRVIQRTDGFDGEKSLREAVGYDVGVVACLRRECYIGLTTVVLTHRIIGDNGDRDANNKR